MRNCKICVCIGIEEASILLSGLNAPLRTNTHSFIAEEFYIILWLMANNNSLVPSSFQLTCCWRMGLKLAVGTFTSLCRRLHGPVGKNTDMLAGITDRLQRYMITHYDKKCILHE